MGPYAALPGLAAVLAVALWASPSLPKGPLLSALGCAVGAAVTSLAAIGVLSRGDRPRWHPWLLAACASAIAAVGLLRPTSPWVGIVVDVALVGAAHAVGSAIGSRVQQAGHLLPATVIAACADVVSVSHPQGPTHMLVESERALSLMAVSFPVPGSREMAPALGVGDLVFVALWLGVARVHGLPALRVALLAGAGALVSFAASAALEAAVPALPAIGALMLAGTPGARGLAGRDRSVAVQAMIIAVIVAVFVFVKHRLLGG